MSVPYPKSTPSSDVPLNGVDQWGGTADPLEKAAKIPNKFDDDVMSTGALPNGINEYGATEDLQEQGEAANTYGTKRIPGMS